MCCDNFRAALIGGMLTVLLVTSDVLSAWQQPDQAGARISESQRIFLSRVARRTVRDAFLDRKTYEPSYVPAELENLHVEVIVRFREHGFLLAAAAARPQPAALAVRDAALTAAENLKAAAAADLDLANKLLIELEVIGPAEHIEVQGDWTQPRALDAFVEPGIHGLLIRVAETHHRFAPSELITSDLLVSEALGEWARARLPGPHMIAAAELFRFPTVHWYQDNKGEIVSLVRGLLPVPPEDVSSTGLRGAIDRLAEYMAYRQLDSGLFTYQFEAGRNRYTEADDVVRQVTAVAAMAADAAAAGRSASRSAATLGIRYHLQGLTAVPDIEDAAYIASAAERNWLDLTAVLAQAMAQHPDAADDEETRHRLIRGILQLQRPSGMFLTAFPPGASLQRQEMAPGDALLALALHYESRPTSDILDAFDRALSFYRGYFRETRLPAFVPTQSQAFARMARLTRRSDFAEFAFELTDWLAEKQLTADNSPWSELWGGIAAYGDARPDVTTARYLTGFAEALKLARSLDDAVRVERYKKLVAGAARFVLQLQIRPQEAYFVRSPRDAVWGIRTSPTLNLVRIDHCGHALIGLTKAHEALYPQ